jgi:hypothetical protein
LKIAKIAKIGNPNPTEPAAKKAGSLFFTYTSVARRASLADVLSRLCAVGF